MLRVRFGDGLYCEKDDWGVETCLGDEVLGFEGERQIEREGILDLEEVALRCRVRNPF